MSWCSDRPVFSSPTPPIHSITAAVTRQFFDIVKTLAGARIASLANVLRIHTPEALFQLMRHPLHPLC